MKRLATSLLLVSTLLFFQSHTFWGFHAHKKINRLAVFTLPPPLIGFYKKHINYITENAINPDQRRYAVDYEAPRHYIDLDVYGDDALEVVPHRWDSAVAKYGEDSLQAYGIVPWHISLMKWQLTQAFEARDLDKILRYSSDIGHYIADSNVPLHTTENYNGQLTGQYGIHGFWETRLPELMDTEYDFFVGKAEYVRDVQEYVWEGVAQAHMALDTVLGFEKELSANFPEGEKYSYEQRGTQVVKVYSKRYSKVYHQRLHGMVERQMRASIKRIGDIWLTCWVDAGQPDFEALIRMDLNERELLRLDKDREAWKERSIESREHN